MSRHSLIPLVVVGALALGCTTASAQDGERPRDDIERRHRDEDERAQALAAEIAKVAAKAEKAEGRERAELHLELARLFHRAERHDEAIREVERALAVDPVFTEAHKMLDDMRVEHRRRREHERLGELEGRHRRERGERRPHDGDPRRGPGHGGDVEDRVARLERAVQDMSRLLDRHGVGRADRDRALQEMRERDARRGRGERRPGVVVAGGRDGRLHLFGEGLDRPSFPVAERGRRLAAQGWLKTINEAMTHLRSAQGERAKETIEQAAKGLAGVAEDMARAARDQTHAGNRMRFGRGGRGGGIGGGRGGEAGRPGRDGGRGGDARRGPPDRWKELELGLQRNRGAAERIQTLEAQLAQQQAHSNELQKKLAEMEQRLKKAEDESPR